MQLLPNISIHIDLRDAATVDALFSALARFTGNGEAVQPEQTVAAPAQAEQPTPQYTLRDLTLAAMPLRDTGKMTELAALLVKYNVSSMQELKDHQLNAFAADMRTLGAQL